ncbi:MAG: hypothetical protein ACP5HG_04610 [Anaerolineae bacterium]
MTRRSRSVQGTYPSRHRAPVGAWAPRLIGREAELAELRQYVATGVLILSETGGAGIGATTLARALAASVAEHYPAGCIEVDLQAGGATSLKPLPPAQVQSRVLYTLDGLQLTREQPNVASADASPGAARASMPRSLPVHPRRLRERYFRAITAGEALLLLDNATAAAQIGQLLPRRGAPVIVTSRVDFGTAFSGLHALTLRELDPEDALRLIAQVAPDTTGLSSRTLQRLAARLQYLPMALRIAGALLSGKSRMASQELLLHLDAAERRILALQGARAPDTPVNIALEAAYELLDDELKPYFEALAVFPAPFTSRGASAVWEIPPDTARSILRQLVAAALLEHDAGSVTYEIHPLARRYAQELLLGQTDRTRHLVSRYIDHYLHEAVEISTLRSSALGPHVLEPEESVVWEHFPKAWRRLQGEDPGWPAVAEVEGWVQDFDPDNYTLLSTVLSVFEDDSDASGGR